MNSPIKGYLIIIGIVLYHIAAIAGIMFLLNCHLAILSIFALVWVFSIPITLWKSCRYAGNKADGLAKEVSTFFNNPKE